MISSLRHVGVAGDSGTSPLGGRCDTARLWAGVAFGSGIAPHQRRFQYDPSSGEIQALLRVPAGYGKVAVLDELQARLQLSPERIVYVEDGCSDVHVMLHVNRRHGLTIAVSEAKYIPPIAKRTILSEDALSVLIPILEDIVGWEAPRIRALFEAHGLLIHEWDKVRTDWLTIRDSLPSAVEEATTRMS
jgi:hypothetical protein